MTQTCFDLQIDDRIAHLRMTRPEKRNSMIPEFWEELPRLIHDIDHNARARVIVISSTGPHFTGGLDIGAFMGGRTRSSRSQGGAGRRCRVYGQA